MFHNDYINTVKLYLKRYEEFNDYIKNIKADIEDFNARLIMTAAPKIPSLSGTPGGAENSSQQEQIAFEKEKIPHKISKLNDELLQIEPMMNRLNRSIEKLPEEDKRLIKEKWIKDSSWNITSKILNMSIGGCRKRSNKILATLAVNMFGRKSCPMGTQIVLLDIVKKQDKKEGQHGA